MSRLAKKPIVVPEGVTVRRDSAAKDGGIWIFKGPKGELQKSFSDYVNIEEAPEGFLISLKSRAPKDAYAMLGTVAALFKSCIAGVKEGFEKKLDIEGIGYKAQMDGDDLVLYLGFTHPVRVPAPDGIFFKLEKNTIIISGADKEKVGGVAAEVRSQKPPEPYKGKGIHYQGEIIRRKAGKKAVAAA